MAWIPSHQELRSHPKTRKAARRAGVSLPTMIGHLHLLWYWALDFAPDGDVARFDAEDLADAAEWDADPEQLIDALVNCGSGGANGFITEDGKLHDWDEYGGKYGKRVEAARKAAAARWDAVPAPSDTDSNADAMRTHSAGNAEERRGEEKERTSPRKRADRATRLPDGWLPAPEPDLVSAVGGHQAAQRELAKFIDYWAAASGAKGRKVDWQATWRNWLRRASEDRRERAGPDQPRPGQPEVGSADWDRRQAEQRELERRLLGDTA